MRPGPRKRPRRSKKPSSEDGWITLILLLTAGGCWIVGLTWLFYTLVQCYLET